jgi:hypothetical protein
MVIEVIAFIVGGVIMAWAFRSAAYAFSGTQWSGIAETAPPVEEEAMPSPEQTESSYRRRERVYQAMLYLLAFGVIGAFVLMAVGALAA